MSPRLSPAQKRLLLWMRTRPTVPKCPGPMKRRSMVVLERLKLVRPVHLVAGRIETWIVTAKGRRVAAVVS